MHNWIWGNGNQSVVVCFPTTPPMESFTVWRDMLQCAATFEMWLRPGSLLAKGELTSKVEIHVAGASKAAAEAVEKAGGSIVIAGDKN